MEPELSEQTKAEMELGRKLAAANAAAFAAAEKERVAETAPPPDTTEADKAVTEAKPLVAQEVFPHAKEPYQPKKPK